MSEKFFSWLKKYYFIVVLVTVIIGFLFSYLNNNYGFTNKILKTIDDSENTINIKSYFTIDQKYFIYSLLSNFFLTFGITLFITMFFSNYFDKKEKKEFEDRLQKFQEDTAKNAYLSLFHQIMDESFFSMIKEDVIQCKKIRTDAKWIYDIQEKNESKNESKNEFLLLRRTIKYTVKNLSSDKQEEEVFFSSFSNSFISSELETIKIDNGNGEYEDLKLDSSFIDNIEKKGTKILISPNASIKIIKIINQKFSGNFLYETQFSNCPLSNLEIEINYPSNYNFSLSCDSFSAKPIKEIDTEGKLIYHFNTAIFKGQGIEFFCEKKKEQKLDN